MYISKISAIRNEAQLKFANHKQLLNQSLRLCNEMQELKKAPTKKAPAKKAPAKKAPAKKRASTKK